VPQDEWTVPDSLYVDAMGQLRSPSEPAHHLGLRAPFFADILNGMARGHVKLCILRFHKGVVPDLHIERAGAPGEWLFSHYVRDSLGREVPSPGIRVRHIKADDMLVPVHYRDAYVDSPVADQETQALVSTLLQCWLTGMLGLYRVGRATLLGLDGRF
jgi:hypothetical protein